MAQAAQDPGSAIPMIGASGAIGGILGAYLLLYPQARVLVLIPLGFFTQLIRVRAVFVLGFWFVLQLFSSAAQTAGTGGVAYWVARGRLRRRRSPDRRLPKARISASRRQARPFAADRRQGPGAARRPLGIGGALSKPIGSERWLRAPPASPKNGTDGCRGTHRKR